jgi:hypothetical protein
MVLNSLSADFICSSFALLCEDGRFQEIGKRGVWSEPRHSAGAQRTHYGAIAVDADMIADSIWMQRVLKLLGLRVQSAVAHSLPLHSYDLERQTAAAFRLLQSGSNVGKVVVTIASIAKEALQGPGWQLISGGTSGLGALTARWLFTHYRAQILLASRSGNVRNEGGVLTSTGMRSMRCDVADTCDVRGVFQTPIRAIWHAAAVVHDGLLDSHFSSTLRVAYMSKVDGMCLLHHASAEAPLHAFTLWSSVSGLFGNAAQANYNAANTCLDATAPLRRGCALVAVSVQWGPWAETGMAALGRDFVSARFKAMGLGLIAPWQGLTALQTAIKSSGPAVLAFMPVLWSRFLARTASRLFEAFSGSENSMLLGRS